MPILYPKPIIINSNNKLAHRVHLVLNKLWPDIGAADDIPPLDGLRGVAVLLVIFFHILLVMKGNFTNTDLLTRTYGFWKFGADGVALFFILSGFLLFIPYSKSV